MSYKNKYISVVIPAAGMGKRMNNNINKQYIKLEGKEVLARTVEKFNNNKFIDEIIVVARADEVEFCKENIINRYGFDKVKSIISGGNERMNSVYNGLKKVKKDCNIVLIHDGARPFITDKIIKQSIDETIKFDSTVVGVKVKDTIKIVDNNNKVIDTPDRDYIWAVQTPQTFKYDIIMGCYDKAISENIKVTDDSMIAEKYGYSVKMILGDYNNIKITTPEDLLFGEKILKEGEAI